jgi:ribosomal protein L40E
MDFDVFSSFGGFVLLVVALTVAFLFRTWATESRRRLHDVLECKSCGATQPGFAKFCRRCGRAL